MIRIAAIYLYQEGKRFDMDYYIYKHLPIVQQRFSSFGLIKIEVDRPLEAPGGLRSPFFAIGYLYFPTLESFQKAYEVQGAQVIADIAKYTDVIPFIQVGEIV